MTSSQRIVLRASPVTDRGGQHLRYRDPELSLETHLLGPLADGHLRVRMAYAGVCGTDAHLVAQNPETGFIRTSAPVSIPAQGRVIGHEGIGIVEGIGHGVQGFKPGDWVVPASIINCGRCPACVSGSPNQCRTASLLGLQVDGLFASIADFPASLAVRVTDAVRNEADKQALACLEPAATALQACELASLRASDRVVVFGAGPIGLFAAIAARLLIGCSEVVVVEPEPFRRKLAERWCTMAQSPEAFATDTTTFDVLIEASGALDAVNNAFPRLASRGRVMLLARAGRPLILDHVDHMITEAITITGCRGHLGGYLDRTLTAYREGLFPLGAAITSVHSGLNDLLELLKNADRIPTRDCKALVEL